MSQIFGSALKTIRADLALSQLALAGALGTTQRHVSFLETGRSRPTRDFVIRLSTGLSLSLPQRAALFDAAGFDNPYRRRDFGAQEMADVLDMLDRRALRHWPFPAFVLDCGWTVLRANAPGRALLSSFMDAGNAPPSLFEIFLSDAFRSRIENWDEVSLIFYFRMMAAAAQDAHLKTLFERARADGLFAHVPDRLAEAGDVPPYVPAVLRGPDGTRLAMSSFVGHLASVHEAAIEGLEVEFMIPMDEATEACLLAAGA